MIVCLWCFRKYIFSLTFQFALLLTLVFILEIAAAIAAYSLQAGLYNLIADKLKMSQNDYMQGGESQAAFDMIQSRVRCIYNIYELIHY